MTPVIFFIPDLRYNEDMKPTVPESGRVVRIEGDEAVVVMEGGKACRGCGAAKIGLCRAGGTTMLLNARNTAQAVPGDKVCIGIDRKTRWTGYFLAYLVPLLGLLLGAAVGNILGELYSLPYLDVLTAFFLMTVSSAISLTRLKKLDRSKRMEVSRIMDKAEFSEHQATEEERLYLRYSGRG